MRRILSDHSRVAIPTESIFLIDYLRAERVPLEARLRLLSKEPELEYWPLRPDWAELSRCQSMAEGIDYVHRLYANLQGKDLWGQKTPKFVRHAQLLMSHFPGSRFVHVVRDGRAVASSLKQSRAHRLNVLYGARRYAQDAALGLKLESSFPDRVLRVTYETLTSSPRPVVKELCQFLNLSFEEEMLTGGPATTSLNPHELKSGHHVNVDKPIDPAIASKWKRALSPSEVQIVEHIAGPIMNELGYSVDVPGPPRVVDELKAKAAHGVRTVRRAAEEIFERPDVWQVARRRWALGSLRTMLRDHLQGM